MHVCVQICVYDEQIGICNMCMYVCMHVYMYMYMYMHMYIYIYMYMYAHTCAHCVLHMYTCKYSCVRHSFGFSGRVAVFWCGPYQANLHDYGPLTLTGLDVASGLRGPGMLSFCMEVFLELKLKGHGWHLGLTGRRDACYVRYGDVSGTVHIDELDSVGEDASILFLWTCWRKAPR